MDNNKLIKSLTTITIIIIALNITDKLLGHPSWQIERLIRLGGEGNFPTWFSSMILAIASYFTYKCSTLTKTIKEGKRIWQLLSLGLLGMSCDETAQIHENLGKILNKYFFQLQGVKQTSWVIILGPPILLLIIIFALKIKQHLKGSEKAAKYLMVGACVYIFGAFVLEHATNFFSHDKLLWLWPLENFMEEGCEMFGVIIIIRGLIMQYNFLQFKGPISVEDRIKNDYTKKTNL